MESDVTRYPADVTALLGGRGGEWTACAESSPEPGPSGRHGAVRRLSPAVGASATSTGPSPGTSDQHPGPRVQDPEPPSRAVSVGRRGSCRPAEQREFPPALGGRAVAAPAGNWFNPAGTATVGDRLALAVSVSVSVSVSGAALHAGRASSASCVNLQRNEPVPGPNAELA